MRHFPAGSSIGRYSIVERLNQGGMGALYLARDPELDRLAVIKMMLDTDRDTSLRARFLREARAAASLRHANIVTIYEVGEFESQPFIAMEYVSGETLAELIARHDPLPIHRKLEIIEQICAGLQHAHRSGMVHRDVKPANIMLDTEGMVRILDFGIARTSGSGMTRDGSIIGTLNYMSPEQMEGRPVDHRSDIFSLGAVGYELIAYRRAFIGEDLFGVAHRVQSTDPEPLSQLCPGLNPEIERVITKALRKNPNDRYASIAMMQDDVRRILNGEIPTGQLPRAGNAFRGEPTVVVSDNFRRRRLRQIQSHLASAEQSLDAGDLQAANDACEEALVLDPEHREANELHARIMSAVTGARVRELLNDARAAIQRDALTEAEQRVVEAAALDPKADQVSAVRRQIEERRLERERQIERERMIRRSLTHAETRLEAGAFDAVLRTVAEVLASDPANAAALALKERAEAALRTREEAERAAAEMVQVAYERFGSGEHAEALKLLEDFPHPSHAIQDALHTLRVRHNEILQARAAEDARRQSNFLTALARSSASLKAGDILQALRSADEALMLKPGSEEAASARNAALEEQHRLHERSERERLAEQTITRALREFARGNEHEAIGLLTSFGSDHPRIEATLTGLRKRSDDNARRQEIVNAIVESRRALADGDIETAREEMDRAASLGASTLELDALRHSVEAVERDAARQREEAAERERLIDAIQTYIDAGEIDSAWEALERASHPAPASPRLATLRAALERLEMIGSALARAEKTASHETAVAILTEALALDPSHAEARKQLAARQKALEQAREDSRVVHEKQAQIALALRRADSTPSHEAAITILTEAAAIDPANAEVARQLASRQRALAQEHEEARLAQERQKQIAAALARAEKTASHEAAVSILADAVALDPTHAGAQQRLAARQKALEQERQEARLAQERRKQIADALKRADTASHAAAVTILTEASALDPGNTEVRQQLAARQKALDREREEARLAKQRQERISAALARADKSASHEDAVTILREASALDPAHAGVQQQLAARQKALDREREAARLAQEREKQIADALKRADKAASHEAAVAILTEASAIDPANSQVRQQLAVRQKALEREREEARLAQERQTQIADALKRADKAASHEAAVAILTEASAIDPANSQVRQQLTARQKALEREREAARLAQERQTQIADALKRADKASHEAAVTVLTEASAIDPANSEVRRQLAVRQKALEREREEARLAHERQKQIAAALKRATKAGSHEAAVAILTEAAALDPANADVRQQLIARQKALEAERAAQIARTEIVEQHRSDSPVVDNSSLPDATLLSPRAVETRNDQTITRDTAGEVSLDTGSAEAGVASAGPEVGVHKHSHRRMTGLWAAAAAVLLIAVLAYVLVRPASRSDSGGPQNAQTTETFAETAREQLAAGDIQKALETVTAGMNVRRGDQALAGVLGDIARDARARMEQSRQGAVSLGADAKVPVFRSAEDRFQEALSLERAGRTTDFVRTALAAADLFNASADIQRVTVAQRAAEQRAADIQRSDAQRRAEQKVAEEKAAELKEAQQRAADLQSAQQRAAAQRAAEQQAEQRAAEQRAAEQRAADQRAAEQRAADQRAAEQRAADQRAAEQRAADQRAAEQRAAEQRAAEQRAAEQRAAEQQRQAAAERTQQAVTRSTQAEEAIQGLLRAYEQAYAALDAAAVRRIFPTVNEGQLRNAFAAARSMRAEIQNPKITVNDTTAVVEGTWTLEYVGKVGGATQRSSSPVRLRLQRDGANWIIASRQ